MGKIFNAGLDKDDKKEGLFKRLKNIEDKNEDQSKKQLDAIKNINISSKPLRTISFSSNLRDEGKNLITNIKELDDLLNKAQLICIKAGGKTIYNFKTFTLPLKFASKICNKDDQQELEVLMNKQNNENRPINKIKIKEKDDTLESAKKLLKIRKEIIRAIKIRVFFRI